eukprot:gene2361-2722_t
MRKWASNSNKLLDRIKSQESNSVNAVCDDETIKVLGISCNCEKDNLIFHLSIFKESQKEQTVTKRLVLSKLSRFYDPLGLSSPVILSLKQLFQEVELFSALKGYSGEKWAQHQLVFALNTSLSKAINCIPYNFVFGRSAWLPVDVLLSTNHDQLLDVNTPVPLNMQKIAVLSSKKFIILCSKFAAQQTACKVDLADPQTDGFDRTRTQTELVPTRLSYSYNTDADDENSEDIPSSDSDIDYSSKSES